MFDYKYRSVTFFFAENKDYNLLSQEINTLTVGTDKFFYYIITVTFLEYNQN